MRLFYLFSYVFSDFPPSTSPAVYEDRQDDSHSEGSFAVSVNEIPSDTQEYPNNTPEVQTEERTVLDLVILTLALEPSNAISDTLYVHEFC